MFTRNVSLYMLSPLMISLTLISTFSNAQIKKTVDARSLLIYEIDSVLSGQVNGNKIPGAVVQIKKAGKVIYRQAYGYAQKFNDAHELLTMPEKMTAEHLFDIASLTKVVGTTTSIMLLVDRGQININDPVSKYIKAFEAPSKAAITISHLLTHTAGLYEWYPLYYRASNKKETFKLIGELPLAFPIGSKRKYSDLGFTILGEIVEVVSGLPLDQFMEQNIFMPLGMKNTTYNPLAKNHCYKIAATSIGNPFEKRMVYDSTLGFKFKEIDPTQWNGWRNYTLKGEVNDGNTWYASGGISGAAGLFSTIDDLQRLVDMLINKGKIGTQQFISENTLNTFLTKDHYNNGLGWMMDPVNSFMKNGPEGTFGHTGFTGTSISVVPGQNISVILLINRQQMGLMNNKEYYDVNFIRQQVFKSVIQFCQ